MNKKFRIKYIPFKLTLRFPVFVNTHTISKREGYYIYLYDNNSLVGIGECAPLPYLSNETLSDVKEELKKLSEIKLPSAILNNSLPIIPIFSNVPSIQFAIESAILMSIATKSNNLCYCHKFALSMKSLPKLSESSIIKCKIARLDLKTELELINTLLNKIPSIQFRFDANNQFSLNEALSYFKNIPTHAINYIEAPCKSDEETQEFYSQTGLKLAYDCPTQNTDITSYSHIVIKPTILGSLFNYHHLLKNKHIIFSSSYESPIGLSCIARLALQINQKDYHGLNTHTIFQSEQEDQIHSFQPLTLQESIKWIETYGHS